MSQTGDLPEKKQAEVSDLASAWMLLTRIPLPAGLQGDPARTGAAGWAYPLVGALLGLVVGIALAVMGWIGVHQGIAAAIALGLMMLA